MDGKFLTGWLGSSGFYSVVRPLSTPAFPWLCSGSWSIGNDHYRRLVPDHRLGVYPSGTPGREPHD